MNDQFKLLTLYLFWFLLTVCGGVLFQSDGYISSPKYPASIVPNTTCDWSIGVDEGFGVKLEFHDLDLPGKVCGGVCVIYFKTSWSK